jgi:hypothetical protein
MGIFSGIISSVSDFFSSTHLNEAATFESQGSNISSDPCTSPAIADQSVGSSISSSDTSDVFSAWGTATPNQICSESCSISHGNSFTDVTYGSFDSGISCSSSFDGGSSFSDSGSSGSWL